MASLSDLNKVKAGSTLWVVFEHTTHSRIDGFAKTTAYEVRAVQCTGRIRGSWKNGRLEVLIPIREPDWWVHSLTQYPMIIDWYTDPTSWGGLKKILKMPLEDLEDSNIFTTYRKALRAAVKLVEDASGRKRFYRDLTYLRYPKLSAEELSQLTGQKTWSVVETMHKWARENGITVLTPQVYRGNESSSRYVDAALRDYQLPMMAVVSPGRQMGKTFATAAAKKALEETGVRVIVHKPRNYKADPGVVFDFKNLFMKDIFKDSAGNEWVVQASDELNLDEASEERRKQLEALLLPDPNQGKKTDMPDKHDPLEKMRFNANLPLHYVHPTPLFDKGAHQRLTQAAREVTNFNPTHLSLTSEGHELAGTGEVDGKTVEVKTNAQPVTDFEEFKPLPEGGGLLLFTNDPLPEPKKDKDD